MQVETYEIERPSDEAVAALADGESHEIIERLGLTGQKRFFNPNTMEAVPYRKMTQEEADVYGVICPRITTVEEYSDGIIPVRVLQVFAHAKSLDFFKSFHIWYPENADIPDPVLVALKDGVPAWMTERYILARWGEVLEPVSKFKGIAEKMYRDKVRTKLAEIKADVDSYISQVDSGYPLKIGTGIPAFHR